MQQATVKRRWTYIRLQGEATQKTAIFKPKRTPLTLNNYYKKKCVHTTNYKHAETEQNELGIVTTSNILVDEVGRFLTMVCYNM